MRRISECECTSMGSVNVTVYSGAEEDTCFCCLADCEGVWQPFCINRRTMSVSGKHRVQVCLVSIDSGQLAYLACVTT